MVGATAPEYRRCDHAPIFSSSRSSPLPDLPWQRRDREAHLLAGLLRTSRLTVLYGEAGSGKTTLLKSGVLPLLRRRASDRALVQSRESGVVVPFPDRRAGGKGAERGADTGDPVAAERLGAFALSLCRNLPDLQRNGHPKWREVEPGLQLDAGWPYSAAAEAAFRSCLATKPVASNDDPSGRAKNRRTEIEFQGVRAAQ